MSYIEPKPLSQYPFWLRWFLKRQKRKYGRTLSPSWLWGRHPKLFAGMLGMLGIFQEKSYPIDTPLRSLISVCIAQLNGCWFCVNLNSDNMLKAAGSAEKAEKVSSFGRQPESKLYGLIALARSVLAVAGTTVGARRAGLLVGGAGSADTSTGIVGTGAGIAGQTSTGEAEAHAIIGQRSTGFAFFTALHYAVAADREGGRAHAVGGLAVGAITHARAAVG